MSAPKKRDPSLDVVRPEAQCTCDTGRYCKYHGRYRKARPVGAESRATRDDASEFDTIEYQRCGGGRRVIHKSID